MTETHWISAIRASDKPRYLALAETIRDDIKSGRLVVGARLPTQRRLASDLKVTVGVVARAYDLLERDRLISGQIGRGTFVQRQRQQKMTGFDLSVAAPPLSNVEDIVREAFIKSIRNSEGQAFLQYSPFNGTHAHRLHAVEFCRQAGISVADDLVAISTGAQSGLSAAISAIGRGQRILTETHTWTGVRAIAAGAEAELVPVLCDEDGILPDALDKAIKKSGAKLAVFVTTLHNPLLFTTSTHRREAVGEVLNKHGVTLIEDDVYRGLVPNAPLPLCTFVDSYLYITSVSKFLWPSARVGIVAGSNAELFARFLGSLALRQLMPNVIAADAVWSLYESGEADRAISRVRTEVAERNRLALDHLGDAISARDERALHFNLKVPKHLVQGRGEAAIDVEGVKVARLSAFAISPDPATASLVRVNIGGFYDRAGYVSALSYLARCRNEAAEFISPLI